MKYSFHGLLINSSKYLFFGIHFSVYQRNNVYKYKLQRNAIVKEMLLDIHFHLFLIFMAKNLVFFHVELNYLISNFSFFFSFMNTFFKSN